MNPKILGAAVAVVLMVGAACSNGDDDASASGGAGAPGTESSGGAKPDEAGAAATTAPAGESGDAGGSGEAGDSGDASDPGSGGEPLATVRAELPADLNDRRLVPLRIDVVRFTRAGDLIELDMLLTNEADPAGQDPPGFTPWTTFSDLPSAADLSGLGLLESGEQKLYLPAFDGEGGCLCTGGLSGTEVAAGQSLPLNATFGGVPGDAESLDIRIPSFPIIEGVGVGG
jgi:hypothetical protein